MKVINSNLRYYSLHLQEATGIQQLIGRDMMSKVRDLISGATYEESSKQVKGK